MAAGRTSSTNWAAILGLAALAMVTVLLSVMAIRSTRADVPEVGQAPGYSPTSTEVAQSSDEADASEAGNDQIEDSAASGASAVPALSRVLAAQDSSLAYRAYTGACPEAGAVVETTTDGGASWFSTDLSLFGSASAPQRILAGEDGYLSTLTLTPDNCVEAVAFQSYSLGTDWETVSEGADLTWHIDPADVSVVHVPGAGMASVPCAAARIASASATAAAVLCSDTTVALTSDAGTTWTVSASLPGAEDLTTSQDGYLVAQTDTPHCDGTAVTQVDSSLGIQTVACVSGIAAAGETAITQATDGTGWLWAGDSMLRSYDGGVTWE